MSEEPFDGDTRNGAGDYDEAAAAVAFAEEVDLWAEVASKMATILAKELPVSGPHMSLYLSALIAKHHSVTLEEFLGGARAAFEQVTLK